MSRNDAHDFTRRLYARIPAHYRAYDAERGQPLLALVTVVAAQVANLRRDLDSQWDNFFIETCADWAVSYIGELVGAKLLQTPVGQSNRLDVWNTVVWRRSKGTPQMLEALARSISGWPTDLTEYFQNLGWSQNMNHVRLDRPLSPDLRDPARLRLLGLAADPFAHALDFKPAGALDQARTVAGVGPVAAWGTPGRYQIRNLGLSVRRVRPYPVRGVTPSAAPSGATPAANNNLFKFDPLYRDVPLLTADEGAAIARVTFESNPWLYVGGPTPSIGVSQYGVPLAIAAAPAGPAPRAGSARPFQFGGAASVTLDPTAGMLAVEAPSTFQLGAAQFLITAQWAPLAGPPVGAPPAVTQPPAAPTNLGYVSTYVAASGSRVFTAGGTGTGAGQLAITVQLGRSAPGLNWTLPFSPPGRFPGAVIAIRAARTGALHMSDVLYV